MQEQLSFEGVMHMDFEGSDPLGTGDSFTSYVSPAPSHSTSDHPVVHSVRLAIINLDHTISVSSDASVPASSFNHLTAARHHLKQFEDEMTQFFQPQRQHTPDNRVPPSYPNYYPDQSLPNGPQASVPFKQQYSPYSGHPNQPPSGLQQSPQQKYRQIQSSTQPQTQSQMSQTQSVQQPPQPQTQFQFQAAYYNQLQQPQVQQPPPQPNSQVQSGQPSQQQSQPYAAPPSGYGHQHQPQLPSQIQQCQQYQLMAQKGQPMQQTPQQSRPDVQMTIQTQGPMGMQSPMPSPSSEVVMSPSFDTTMGSPEFPSSPYSDDWQKGATPSDMKQNNQTFTDIKVFKAVPHQKPHYKNTRRVPSVLSNTQASTMMYQFSLNEGRSSRKRGRGNSSKSPNYYTNNNMASLTGSFSGNPDEEDVMSIGSNGPSAPNVSNQGSLSVNNPYTATEENGHNGQISETVMTAPQSNSEPDLTAHNSFGPNNGSIQPTNSNNNFNAGNYGLYNTPNSSNPTTPSTTHPYSGSAPQNNPSSTVSLPMSKDSPLNSLDVSYMIGAGTYGTVHLAKHRSDGNYYCLKCLKRQTIYKHKQTEHIQSEKTILKNISYPGIVKLYSTFNDLENVYLLMEYVPGGELFTYIRKYGHLSESVTKFFVAEIVIILDFLHGMNIIYRDLKPENILLDVSGHVKLTDFGFAKVVTDRTWTMCGTPDYLAPEIISCTGHNKSVDWWSLGILIFEMMMGYPPFRDENTLKLFQKICDPSMLIIPESLGKEVRDLLLRYAIASRDSQIIRLLVINPTHRLGSGHRGILEITDHPWFTEVDWSVVAKREGRGPIVPVVNGPNDISNYLCHPVVHYDNASDVQIPEDVQNIFDNF